MVYAIFCQNLPFQHKKKSTTGMLNLKKICNTATVSSQICDGIVATFYIQKLLFYFTYKNQPPLSTVSFSLSLSLEYIILLCRCIILLCRYIILMCNIIK